MESEDVIDETPEETTVEENEVEGPNDSGYASSASGSSRSSSISDYDTANEDLQTVTDELERNLNITDDELESALNDDIDLLIIDDNDEKNSVSFGKTMTVSDVISRSVADGQNPDEFDLKIDGRVLPRTITLRDAGITRGTKMRLVEREMQIFIRRVDGRTSTMTIRSSSTILSLKEQFFYTDQVPVHQQRLLFQSSELENARTAASYNIRNNSTLEMVYRLRGGCATQII